ncbi:hypothetical protein H4Q26_002019 [Puccinia striiformis f. sp. tritici PST-130]|nr:hypothetical protein H4Q26_002019 [Puccinia striiformis f. sp. tritici PST-130]
MTSRLKHDDILLLEQPLLKVPTDALRSSLRSTQRVLERDFDKLNTSLKEVAADGASPPQSTILTDLDQSFVIDIEKSNQTVKVIDNLLSKARGLKRKYKKFSQTRLDRHLVDFMLVQVILICSISEPSSHIEMLTDAPLFSELDRIEKALNDHSCSEALAWCKENSAALKKTQRLRWLTTSGPGDSNHTTTSNLGGPPPPSSSSNYDPSLIHRTDNVNRDYSQRRNPDCPTCDPVGLGELAKECPWSHHVNSIIVCGLTGKVVNDGDGLAVLPNGRVYSKDGLESRACKEGGKIVCPRTGQVFDINEIRRVFIS